MLMQKKYILILSALYYAAPVVSAEIGSQDFSVTSESVSYFDFNLAQASTIDIATGSFFIDPEILLFSGTEGNLGNLLKADDDSCLSVDCGLVGNNQFNALINDFELTPGDYTVALAESVLTEDEARSGVNQSSLSTKAAESEVLLMVGDENLIIPGEGTGTGSEKLSRYSNNIVDTGSNEANTAIAVVGLCENNESAACVNLDSATTEEQVGAVQQLTPQQVNTFKASSVATANSSVNGVNARISGVRSNGYSGGLNILNMPQSGSGAGDINESNFGVFVNADGQFGSKKQSTNETGYKYQGGGITLGLDKAINDHSIIGLAFNYSRTENNFDNQSGKLTSDAYSGSVFGSYYLDDFYIDLVGSVGTKNFKFQRDFSYATNGNLSQFTANGATSAMQYMTSLNVGYNFNVKSFSIIPSARLNYSMTQIDAYSESGAGTWNVAYTNQEIESLTTVLGAKFSYVFSLPWAVITPQLYSEWEHEFSYNAQKQSVNFVDNNSNRFIIYSDSPDRDYARIGCSLAAQFMNGISGFIAYDSIVGRRNVTNNAVSGGIRIEI